MSISAPNPNYNEDANRHPDYGLPHKKFNYKYVEVGLWIKENPRRLVHVSILPLADNQTPSLRECVDKMIDVVPAKHDGFSFYYYQQLNQQRTDINVLGAIIHPRG